MKTQYILKNILATVLTGSFGLGVYAQCSETMVHTTDGDTAVYTCPGDQVADIIMLMNDAEASEMFAYIVTDDMNMILEVPGDVPQIDVEEAGVGICRVWGLTYTGTLTAAMGQDLMEAGLATGCTQISNNFVSLYRDMPDAGIISIEGGGTTTTVTTGDDIADVVEFGTNTSSISNYAWIITDDESMILGVEHVPMHDFEPAGPGTCHVYGVSYTGMLNAPMGADVTMIELSDDCYDLSANHITVVRLSVGINDAGSIQPLRIHPTLVVNEMIIELDNTLLPGSNIQIADMQGRLVKEVSAAMATDRIIVSVAELPSGQYICTMLTTEGRSVGRFMKQ